MAHLVCILRIQVIDRELICLEPILLLIMEPQLPLIDLGQIIKVTHLIGCPQLRHLLIHIQIGVSTLFPFRFIVVLEYVQRLLPDQLLIHA